MLDTYTSILEGSIGAIPRRLMVVEEDYTAARRILVEAGHLPDPDKPLLRKPLVGRPPAGRPHPPEAAA